MHGNRHAVFGFLRQTTALQLLEDHSRQAFISIVAKARHRQFVERRSWLCQRVQSSRGDDVGHRCRELLCCDFIYSFLWLDYVQQIVVPETFNYSRIDLLRTVLHELRNEKRNAIEEENEILYPVPVVPHWIWVVEGEFLRFASMFCRSGHISEFVYQPANRLP